MSAKYSAVTAAFFAALAVPAAVTLDPLAFLSPDIVLSTNEREQLDAGDPVVSVLPGRDGYLWLSAVIRVHVDGERLTAWSSRVEALQKGRYVPEIGRFSAVPRVEDLEGLTIAAEDLDEMRRCVRGDCGIKLSDAEIESLAPARNHSELDAMFRRILVQRATDYLAHGDMSGLPYHDHQTPVYPGEALGSLLQRLQFLQNNLTCYAEYLRRFPAGRDPHVTESFLYWSKETLGMKPIVSITHFSVAQFEDPRLPEAVVVAKQVYATHYKDAALTVTALAGSGPDRYLVYVNRARVDAFQGLFGGVVRRVVERRVKAEAPGILRALRERLESGAPNGTSVAH